MSDKAAKKKQFILDTAKGVFAKKGFKDVTMKDIVDACGISRGGLYIYFDNTESILLECLDNESNADYLTDNTAGDALVMFLNDQKKAILSKEDDLTVAEYEYMFLKKSEGTECALASLFEKNVEMVAGLIDKGVESEEFYCEDSKAAAQNIMYALEGLKLKSKTIGVNEKDVDTELLYILSGLIAEEE